LAPSSTVATSLSRTIEPTLSLFRMMFSNCSGVCNRLFAVTVALSCWPRRCGRAAELAGCHLRVLRLIAAVTSLASASILPACRDRARCASHSRSRTAGVSPTPGTRFSVSFSVLST
jgi:hypothetical protein